VGIVWMIIGLLIFLIYRRSRRLPFLHAPPVDKHNVWPSHQESDEFKLKS
jgi:hypothetical protein